MSPTLDEVLKNAWDCLDANVIALDNGGHVDMSVFDNKARVFCEMLAALPKEQAKHYQIGLKNLIEHLAEVTHKLEERKNQLGEKIDAMNQRQHAYNAYGNAMFLALQTIESEN